MGKWLPGVSFSGDAIEWVSADVFMSVFLKLKVPRFRRCGVEVTVAVTVSALIDRRGRDPDTRRPRAEAFFYAVLEINLAK